MAILNKASRFLRRNKRNAPVQDQAQPEEYDTPEEFFGADEADEEMAGLSSPDGSLLAVQQQQQQELDDSETEEEAARKRTKLEKVLWEVWGNEQIAEYLFEQIAAFANPESAKKTKHGFKVKLNNGGKVEFGLVKKKGEQPYEAFKSRRRGFSQEDAAVMVALSRAHGWETINVHGSKKNKELLWLEVKMLSLREEFQFEQQKAMGLIDPDTPFKGPDVGNWRPSENSDVFKQWKQAQAELKELLNGMPLDPEDPAATQGQPGQQPVAEETAGEEPAAKNEQEARFYKDAQSKWHDRENKDAVVSRAEVDKEVAAGNGKADYRSARQRAAEEDGKLANAFGGASAKTPKAKANKPAQDNTNDDKEAPVQRARQQAEHPKTATRRSAQPRNTAPRR